jgi:amidase
MSMLLWQVRADMAPHRPVTRHAVPPAGDIVRLSAVELAAGIRARKLSVREVAAAFLDRIEAVNGHVNAIVSLRERGDILREADKADGFLAGNPEKAGSLFGLPVAIKDLAQTRGLRTTFGSPIFADNVPDQDEFFVARMREAGAIVIGKTNAPEFGLGSNTYNPVFGATLNAFDPRWTAGGSSGGAAVALALDMLPVADGSDFGGSLRNPAAYNNVYGFRPSQGLVPGGPSFEVFHAQMGVEGPMGRSVADMALLLDVQAGHDPRAPLSLEGHGDFLARLGTPSRGGRIAWLANLGGVLPMEQGVLALCEEAIGRFREAGFAAEAFVPDFDFEALWQAFVTLRQASSGCALKTLADDPARRPLLKPEALWEAEGAARLTAPQVHAATVTRSAWHRALLAVFERFDFLAIPTAQVFPFDVSTHWPRWPARRWTATTAGCRFLPWPRWPARLPPICRLASMRPAGRWDCN